MQWSKSTRRQLGVGIPMLGLVFSSVNRYLHTLHPATPKHHCKATGTNSESIWMTRDTVAWDSEQKRATPENPCGPKGRTEDTPEVKTLKIKI